MLRLASIPIGLMLLVLGALFWSGSGKARKADFTFINRGDIITLDLNLMSYQQDFRLTYAIREGLYCPDPETYEPIPAGAESHEVSPDGRVWTFHLRKSAKWSNGDPVTAHDYIFSWRRFFEEPGEYTYLFYYIKNAKAYETSYTSGEPIDIRSVGMEAVDDYTFRLTLNDPVTFLLDLVAFPPFYPRNERSMTAFRDFNDKPMMNLVGDYLAKQQKDIKKLTQAEILAELPGFAAQNTSADTKVAVAKMIRYGSIKHTYLNEYTRPPNVVTNGPFMLTEWEFKRRLWLEKSPTYWDRDAVHVNTIEMVVNDNVLSQFLQYEAGTVDWLADITTDLASELRARGRTDLRASKAFGTAFLTLMCKPQLPKSIFNGAKNPLADQRVRQALAMSIDKKFITERVTRMGEEVATTYFPPGTLPGFETLPGLPFDVAKAQSLLAEAGYPKGKGFPALPILYNSDNPTRARIVQVLKEQWKQNLGIDVEIESQELKIYRNRVTEKDYAIAMVAWYGDYPDVSTFTDKYLSTSLQNDSAWANMQFDQLCDDATKEADAAKRMLILQKAEALIDTEVPIVPLYHYVNCSMRRDYVKGIKENPRNLTVFKGLRLDKAGSNGAN